MDRSVNSKNIECPLYNSQYPYVGIWKTSLDDNFGIIIEKAKDEMYSISFFGPGGRFQPGKWMPNTKVKDDPKYTIIDKDTIEFSSNRYYRVENEES